jgi:hypothetical protein
VLGPFKTGNDKIDLSFSPDLESSITGETAIAFDLPVESGDSTLSWKSVTANKKGYVNLGREIGSPHFAAAYAYAEVESIHGRETVVRCGSDDGIKIWLNGKVVHENDVQRGFVAGQDEAAIFLQEGINRFVIKVTNVVGGWGFGVSIPKANF